jgi:hypothetical protein
MRQTRRLRARDIAVRDRAVDLLMLRVPVVDRRREDERAIAQEGAVGDLLDPVADLAGEVQAQAIAADGAGKGGVDDGGRDAQGSLGVAGKVSAREG